MSTTKVEDSYQRGSSMSYTLTTPLLTSKPVKIDEESLCDYREKYRASVTRRLGEFEVLRGAPRERVFSELCYCILTPQSSALTCDKIVEELDRKGLLLDPGSKRSVLENPLKKARFWRNKTKYIIKAWKRFASNGGDIASELSMRQREYGTNQELRNWLREEVRGMGIGMKEASHFLRNVGYGEGIAIVDRHIMNCLLDMNIIKKEEAILKSERAYLEMEERIAGFSTQVGIPMEELDLLLWSAKTGYIYK